MLESTPLAPRHALITGGGTGIGAAIARRLAADGARVTLVGLRAAPIEAVAATLPSAIARVVDVISRAEVNAAFAAARAVQGPIDILIANAGSAESGRFEAQDFD